MSLGEFENASQEMAVTERCELIGGRLVRGRRSPTAAHNIIVDNIVGALLVALRDRSGDFRPVAKTFWLKRAALALAVLPDVMVYAGRLFPAATSLDDPVVIFEIETPESVAARPEKWKLYKQIGSLQAYVLVDHGVAGIDVFERVDGGWFFRPRLDLPTSVLELPAIGAAIALTDIYRDVGFG